MALLDELLRKIKRFEHYGKLQSHERNEIGKALDEVQSLLPRGQFGPWIAQNLWFSYGMASYYMKCYRDSAIATRYNEASKNNEFFRQSTAEAEPQSSGDGKMSTDDYKKLVMYMRDNVELTNKIAAMEKSLQFARKQASDASQASLAKDQQILRLRRELENERNGSNPFADLFGGAKTTLSKADYRVVMSALHPDKAMSDEQREAFTRASQIINGKMKA